MSMAEPVKRSRSIPLRILLFAAFTATSACGNPPPPAEVFIPGPEATTTVSVSASSAHAAVGEPVVLTAERRASGFIQVPIGKVPEGVGWWRSEPPSYEESVADNLRWMVQPEGQSRFNTDFRPDHKRIVQFTSPGVYRLHGISALYGPSTVRSNEITIEVTGDTGKE